MTARNQRVNALEVRQMISDSTTIHRLRRHETFTRIDNESVRDSRMSFKATGLLTFMLSRPDDWHFFIEELAEAKTDGEFSVRAGMKELVDLGYVRRENVREDGRIVGVIVHVYERPIVTPKRKRRSEKA